MYKPFSFPLDAPLYANTSYLYLMMISSITKYTRFYMVIPSDPPISKYPMIILSVFFFNPKTTSK